MEIKNLRKAARRILKAVKSKERIVLYGDSDMDGISSTVILKEAIENLGGEAAFFYFPDRQNDGYGLNRKALSVLKKYAPALLIVLDCGIGNFKEVEEAEKMGFEVIIIDHHEVLDKLPKASIIIDPKQPKDKYPFKQLATVGLVLYLADYLLGKNLSSALKNNFLELAAMATIADMMPRVEDNKKIIDEGVPLLRDSWRPGIQALFSVWSKEEIINGEAEAKGYLGFNYLSPIQQVEKMNSLLNIPQTEDGLPLVFKLLTCPDIETANKIAGKLFKKHIQKKRKISQITSILEEKVLKGENEKIVFEGRAGWELILLGTVASIISRKFNKPVFLYQKMKSESPGSVRAPEGFNAVEMMKKCSQFLETFGGHPQAAGFRVKNKHLEEFKNCLIKNI
ncbi:MAG TPA: hypothetical protein ENL27_01625 [Candidatus Parcubacteria bacterium]|nr:hypothetical protein [Candidatus Parcubacteria bacterium]